jgi:hypothetical protein
MAVVLHIRLHSSPTAVSEKPQVRWEKHMFALYAVSVLIIARSLFRLVEFTQDPDGQILKTEWMMYAFDASLLLASTVYFARDILAGCLGTPGRPAGWLGRILMTVRCRLVSTARNSDRKNNIQIDFQ